MDYYKSEDLKKFAEIGAFAPELAEGFFTYYNRVMGSDGALSRREKALIALAVSHAMKCPYCIDAYTTTCLETGSNPEQMTEAVHVAAAMQAGIALVHGVQMQNHMRAKGAID
jgi:alkylhydroperoxidase/carboxymuconolactone decarboxylase family protein